MPNMLQILIVGAGPTGLTLALELVRQNISVRIVDKTLPRPKSDSRAIGTHARTMEIFERIGVLPEMLDLGLCWRGFNFYQNNRQIGRFTFDYVRSKYNFALILPQAETERILREKLASFGVAVEHETELTAIEQTQNTVRATLKNKDGEVETVETAFLAGCDGAKSQTRKLLNLDFAGKRLQGSYLIDCEIDWNQTELREGNTFFENGWRLIVGQLPENRWRVVVNLPHDDRRLREETATIELMQSFVYHFDLKMRLRNPTWASKFWLSVRRVEKMRVNRIFLAGDAAHNVCPNAGQGMNAGIADAVNLAEKLSAFLHNRADNTILDAYERERLPVIKKLLAASEKMENLMTLRDGFAARARNFALPFVSKSKLLQKRIGNQIAGLNQR